MCVWFSLFSDGGSSSMRGDSEMMMMGVRSTNQSPQSVGSSGMDSGVDSLSDQIGDLPHVAISLCGGLTDNREITRGRIEIWARRRWQKEENKFTVQFTLKCRSRSVISSFTFRERILFKMHVCHSVCVLAPCLYHLCVFIQQRSSRRGPSPTSSSLKTLLSSMTQTWWSRSETSMY